VSARGDLIFIGDVHLDRGDPLLERFVGFLERVSRSSRRIVLMGDLFNLWVGRAELEQPHQTVVVAKLEELRGRGVVVRYLEGNRDFRVGPCYAGRAFDDVSDSALVECHGGRRLVAIHGDLANLADYRYRAWRRLSRTRLVWYVFNLLPRWRRLRFADGLERRLRASNPDFKRSFPEAAVRAYAARLLGPGDDALVLGHFHVEQDLAPPPGRVLVLPEWKSSRRHLRVGPDGEIGFVDSE
jgi:UDP-2,3-diacylglucosamine hydrolase